MNVAALKPGKATSSPTGVDSESIIKKARSNEVFFAVVGPVGAGSSRVVDSLRRALEASRYEPVTIKASDLIREWAARQSIPYPQGDDKTLANVTTMQDLGDQMRKADKASVARAVIGRIAEARALAMKIPYTPGLVIEPDDGKRAYLIDSIRHPAEIQLLRRTYGQSFALIGVVCQESERERRVLGKYFTDPQRRQDKFASQAREFIKRDADDVDNKHGQHVGDAFHQADFFVDNTKSDPKDEQQLLDEGLGRLINIVTHEKLIRPTIEETAMHHAHSARVRSACLSRQVGAALIDEGGTVVATGTNEVPRAGGGVYGEHFASKFPPHDDRCAFSRGVCSNNQEQNAIVAELIEQLPELKDVSDKFDLAARIRKTRLGSLIEFSRAVHAEMDAVLSAGRVGVSTIGTRLFVTTFPCHYCARHIVGAGVSEVQYIEPYPKSLALKLHCDAIEVDADNWNPPERISIAEKRKLSEPPAEGRVLFRPFNGVAPRLYERAFEKTWELKNKVTGEMKMTPPGWGDGWGAFTLSYPQLEAKLSES